MRSLTLELAEHHLSVSEIRSIGLFGAIELVKDREIREPMAPSNGSGSEKDAFRQSLLSQELPTPIGKTYGQSRLCSSPRTSWT